MIISWDWLSTYLSMPTGLIMSQLGNPPTPAEVTGVAADWLEMGQLDTMLNAELKGNMSGCES